MKSIYDLLRNKIYSFDSISELIYKINLLDDNEKEFLLRSIICDLYKFEKFTEGKLKNFVDYSTDFILEQCNYNYSLLAEILIEAKKYSSLSDIEKIIVMDKISNNYNDNRAVEISKLHAIDKVTYTFKYDLDSMKEYFSDYLGKYGEFFDNSMIATDFIFYKLNYLKKINKDEYNKVLTSFIEDYYKWSSYLEHNNQKKIFDNSYVYLYLIENLPMKQILKSCKKSDVFLTSLIRDSLYYSTAFDNEKKEVEKYFDNNTSEQVKKKLKNIN